MNIGFPLRIDGRGRTREVAEPEHISQMIEQILFTAPGERVMRPTFGTGVMQLVFAPNSSELATATEFMIQSALQQFLGDRIKVEAVQVTSDEARLQIRVVYVLLRNGERSAAHFVREI